MILDTSFLIDLIRGKDTKTKEKAEELDREFVTRMITSISVIDASKILNKKVLLKGLSA